MQSYKMYLDDGVSRDSAPQDTLANAAAATGQMVNSLDDLLARSLYREVEISQIWSVSYSCSIRLLHTDILHSRL